jgi:hypothetical protein
MPERGILWLLDLKSEATRFKNRNISATIVADVKRFGHQIKRTRFSAHTAGFLMEQKAIQSVAPSYLASCGALEL